MEKKVLIMGDDNSGLMAAKIAELKSLHPDMEIVTLQEAKERGLSQTFEIKAPPIPDLSSIAIEPPPFYKGESARAKRRKAERAKKKKR
jgi:hypothetical protein